MIFYSLISKEDENGNWIEVWRGKFSHQNPIRVIDKEQKRTGRSVEKTTIEWLESSLLENAQGRGEAASKRIARKYKMKASDLHCIPIYEKPIDIRFCERLFTFMMDAEEGYGLSAFGFKND